MFRQNCCSVSIVSRNFHVMYLSSLSLIISEQFSPKLLHEALHCYWNNRYTYYLPFCLATLYTFANVNNFSSISIRLTGCWILSHLFYNFPLDYLSLIARHWILQSIHISIYHIQIRLLRLFNIILKSIYIFQFQFSILVTFKIIFSHVNVLNVIITPYFIHFLFKYCWLL